MSDVLLRIHGRPRPAGVLLTVPLLVVFATLTTIGIMVGDDLFAAFGVLLSAALASVLVVIAVDGWFGWLSVTRDAAEWVITRGSPVRRRTQRLLAERIVFVETRLEPRAPICDLVLGSHWVPDGARVHPRVFDLVWALLIRFAGRRIGPRSWGPVVRVHFAPPPVGSKYFEHYIDLGKGIDRIEELERLRDLLARPW